MNNEFEGGLSLSGRDFSVCDSGCLIRYELKAPWTIVYTSSTNIVIDGRDNTSPGTTISVIINITWWWWTVFSIKEVKWRTKWSRRGVSICICPSSDIGEICRRSIWKKSLSPWLCRRSQILLCNESNCLMAQCSPSKGNRNESSKDSENYNLEHVKRRRRESEYCYKLNSIQNARDVLEYLCPF